MEPGYIILGLIIAAGLAFIPASIAGQKGRSFGAWYFYGLLLWIVAIFHAISLPYPEKSSGAAGKPEREQPCILLNSTSNGRTIDINSPVYIEGYDIVKSGENKAGLSIRFRNMCGRTVTAIKLTAVGCNSFGDVVQVDGKDEFNIIIQDLSEKPSSYFKINSIIPLPSDEIRKVELSVSQVCFSDGTRSIHQPEYICVDRCKIEGDDLKAAQLIMSDAKYFPIEKETYWMCACGRANKKTENICMLCGKSKKYIFNAFSSESVAKVRNDIEQEKAKRLAAVAVQDKKDEKTIKLWSVATVSVVILFVVIIVTAGYINSRNDRDADSSASESVSETAYVDPCVADTQWYLDNYNKETEITTNPTVDQRIADLQGRWCCYDEDIEISGTEVKWKYSDNDTYSNIYHCVILGKNKLENNKAVGDCVRRTFELVNGDLHYTYYYDDGSCETVEYYLLVKR